MKALVFILASLVVSIYLACGCDQCMPVEVEQKDRWMDSQMDG
jgi:hypothetical protein